MSQIQALWSLSIHSFNIIDVQLFLGLLLDCEFHLLNTVVVGMGLQWILRWLLVRLFK